MGLVYRCDDLSNPCMWSDATWAPDYGTFYDNYRTTELKSVVAQSSAASEWYAAADIAKEAEFLRNLFSDLGMPQNGAIPLLCDNQSTIGQTLNAVDQHSSRHLGMRLHFLRQQCHARRLKLFFVPSRFQLADMTTKKLPRPCHEFLRSQLGVVSISDFRSQLRTVSRPSWKGRGITRASYCHYAGYIALIFLNSEFLVILVISVIPVTCEYIQLNHSY